MCMVCPCYCFVDGLSKKCINVYKKGENVKLINHDGLPILMLLYMMLAYLMLFVCIMLIAIIINLLGCSSY